MLKDAIHLGNYKAPVADAMRNIISALKKIFTGDRYQELYFLKKNISASDDDNLLPAFRWALISLVYATMGEQKKSYAAWDTSRLLTVNEPCFSIRCLAWSLAQLHMAGSSIPPLFNLEYGNIYLAALFVDPLLAAKGIVQYPYKVSWMANALMRATATAHYLASGATKDRSLLDRYLNEYLNSNIHNVPSSEIIASDIVTAQQAACAAYFVTCKNANTDILKQMEITNKARLQFITGTTQLGKPDALSKDKSLFYILRRWNSFTPIVPDEANKKRIYRGGGYFIWHQNKGTVVDPGFRFIRNFADAGGRVADIDNIVMTHAHNDHTADLESLFTVLYQHNATIKDTLKKMGAYLPDLQVGYESFLDTHPNATPAEKKSFLAALQSGTGAGDGNTKADWLDLREQLAKNDMPPGTTITDTETKKDTDGIDRAIVAMCLPKDGGNLTYTPDRVTNTVVSPKSSEDVLKDAGHAQKKVQVYANLGTMRKFNAIIDPDSQYIDYIGGVHIIEPGQTYTLAKEDSGHHNELKMIVHKAYHNEVVTKNYATGLEFVFGQLDPYTGSPTRHVLITSDTSLCWTFKPDQTDAKPPKDETKPDYTGRQNLQFTKNEVTKDYPKPPTTTPDLLLPHIGSIKDYEVSPPDFNPKDFIYKNHLGIIGVSQVIAATKPVVALITEFGEEMTEVIKLSVEMAGLGVRGVNTLLASGGEPQLTTNILPADIGLMYHLNENKYYGAVTWDTGEAKLVWPVNSGGDVAVGISPDKLDAGYAEEKTFPITYKAKA